MHEVRQEDGISHSRDNHDLSPLLPRKIFLSSSLSLSLLANATLSMLFSRGTGIDLVHRFFHIRRVVHSKEKGDGHSTARKRILRKLASHRITPHCRENKDQVTRSKSQNRSFEPHPIVRRTLRYRQTVRLIRTHDSGGKGTRGDEERERERERESGGAIVVDRCCNEIQRKRVACSLLEPKRFKAKRSAEP